MASVNVAPSRLQSIIQHAQTLQEREGAMSADPPIHNKVESLTPSTLKTWLRQLDQDSHLLDEIQRIASEHQKIIRRERARVQNSLQPLLRLPVEVLSSILELAALRRDDPIQHDSYSVPSHVHSFQSFHSLSCLCRHLWHVAVNTPRCWRNVNIFITNTIRSTPSIVLENRLNRSRNYSFNVTIHVNSAFINLFALKDSLFGLRLHAGRCRSIKVCSGANDEDFSRITSLIRDCKLELPALRAVAIIDSSFAPFARSTVFHSDRGIAPFWDNTTPYIESAEIQFKVFTQKMTQMPALADIALPWGSLKRLRILHGFDADLVATMLASCQSLEHFYWRGVLDDDRDSVDPPIALPRARSITLCENTTALVRFIVPNCEQLCMHEEISHLDVGIFLDDHSDETDFPQIKRLSLPYGEEFNGGLTSFLSNHPLLEEIFISIVESVLSGTEQRCELFDGFASGISPDLSSVDPHAQQMPFLPLLRTLYCQTEITDWCDERMGQTGAARALAESLRRLLHRRTNLSIKLMFNQLHRTQLPEEVDLLKKEFGSRFVTVDYDAVPEWAKEWHACDDF